MVFTPNELFHISLAFYRARTGKKDGESKDPWELILILSSIAPFPHSLTGLDTEPNLILQKYRALSSDEQSQFDEKMWAFINRYGMRAHYQRMIGNITQPRHPLQIEKDRKETTEWLVNSFMPKEFKIVPTKSVSEMSEESQTVIYRLNRIISMCGLATERNESDFSEAVRELLEEAGLYKDEWSWHAKRPKESISLTGSDSSEKRNLLIHVIAKLKGIPDGGAELFPFDLIDTLGQVYGIDTNEIEADEPVNTRKLLRELWRIK